MRDDNQSSGLRRRTRLSGHTGAIGAVAWSPDGHEIATVSDESGLIVFNVSTGQRRRERALGWSFATLDWHAESDAIVGVADRNVRIVDGRTLRPHPFSVGVSTQMDVVCWAQSRIQLAHTRHEQPARVYRFRPDWTLEREVELGRSDFGSPLVWSPDSRFVAGRAGGEVCVFGAEDGVVVARLSSAPLRWAAWAPDQSLLGFSSGNSVAMFDTSTWVRTYDLEHSTGVERALWSPCGRFLATIGSGGALREPKAPLTHVLTIWRTDSWEIVSERKYEAPEYGTRIAFAFHPEAPLLALAAGDRTALEILELDAPRLLAATAEHTQRYTTAKVVLVGDSGVGKTGIGYRIATGEFKEHPSTHGQYFWLVDELSTRRADGTECEVVLWDLAGQPDYRLTHVLFLDDADAALVVFDATRGPSALDAAEFWIEALKAGRDRPCPTILVGARLDRGGAAISSNELAAFAERHDIAAGYVGTSAKERTGMDELVARLRDAIPWSSMSATITTTTFRSIKEQVLRLKQASTETAPRLMTVAELRELLDQDGVIEEAPESHLWTAISNLEVHGYVRILRTASGDRVVLLQPELLQNLAASIIAAARKNERGLGAIDEGIAIEGGYQFPEVSVLSEEHGQILLEAALVLLLAHNVCFRETLGSQALLIFPELINEKPPGLAETTRQRDDVTYVIEGNVQNVYASLVVLLGYTNVLIRRNQWQDRAEYEMDGLRVGFEQVRDRANSLQLTLFYEETATSALKRLFQGLVEQFLLRRKVSVRRYPHVECPECGSALDRGQVIRFVDKGTGRTFCPEHGHEIQIPTSAARVALTAAESAVVQKQSTLASRRTSLTVALAHLRSYLAEYGDPTRRPVSFISYAWGDREHEQWVRQRLAPDLAEGNIEVILDARETGYGDHIARFIERIDTADFVIVVGTPMYRRKYENAKKAGSVVAAEMDLVSKRFLGSEVVKTTVIPVLRAGSAEDSFPPLMHSRIYADVRTDDAYLQTVFELVLQLWNVSSDDPAIADIVAGLRGEQGRG